MKTVFKKVIFEKDGFCIIADKEERIFQGNLLHKADDLLNIPVDVKADEVIHPKYGKRYKIKNYTVLEEPLSFFLRKVVKSGLPRETVTDIADNYTLQEFKQILENNETELLNIKNLGKVRLAKIKKAFLEKKDLIELTEILSQTGITSDFLQRVYKFIINYNKKNKNPITPADIQKNPYLLTMIDGVGFKKADSIALKLGIGELDEIRITAYIKYAINQITNNKGDTLHLKQDIFNLMVDELGFEENQIEASVVFEKSLTKLINSKEIIEISNELLSNEIYLIENKFYRYEKYIIDIINNYENMKYWQNDIDIDFIEKFIKKNAKHNLSDKQKQAVINFITTPYPFFILAGYAGSGKTTTSKLIMDIYAKLYGKEKIIACALSGNASNRIKSVTGYESKTIHSLLGYRGNGFMHGKDNPLNYRLIVLDEASMVDIYLFYSLLQAIDFKKTKLFIIGDNAQLPPVGAGEVFSDMLEIKSIQKIILDKVQRQKEEQVINQFAKEIRKGIVPKGYADKKYEDFIFYKKEIENYFKLSKILKDKEKKEIRDELNLKIKNDINIISKNINDKFLSKVKFKIEECLKTDNFDNFQKLAHYFINTYQIITPQKKGILGTIEMNKAAKDIFNKYEISNHPYHLDELDKVIHLKNKNKNTFSLKIFKDLKETTLNNKDINAESKINILNDLVYGMDETYSKTRVFNGQTGIVIDIRCYTIGEKDDVEIKCYIFVYYPNEDYVAVYDDYEIKNGIIDLAYCFTIHKSQGSEYDYVVIPISLSNAFMLNNKLLYTAVTRAKKKLILIGETYAFKIGVKKKDEIKRKTLLKLELEK